MLPSNPVIIVKLNDKFQNQLGLNHNKYLFEDFNRFITKIIRKILNYSIKSNFYYHDNGVFRNISLNDLQELKSGEYLLYTNLNDAFLGLKKFKKEDFLKLPPKMVVNVK